MVSLQTKNPMIEPNITNTLTNPSIYAAEKMNRFSDTMNT